MELARPKIAVAGLAAAVTLAAVVGPSVPAAGAGPRAPAAAASVSAAGPSVAAAGPSGSAAGPSVSADRPGVSAAGSATLRRAASTLSACERSPGGGLTLANVAAHGSQLVAVGSNGLIATSSDASNWTVRPSTVQHDLRGVVWTGQRWVVVGDIGTIVSSVDGRHWQAATGIPNTGLRSAVAAREGLVAAAGTAGDVVTSSNGLSWRTQVSGTSEILWGGTALGSTLLLSGKDSTVIASSDGKHWTPVPTHPYPTGDPAAPRPFLWQMAANGPRVTAVGDFGSVLEGTLSSLTAVPSPTTEILRGVTYGDGIGVIVGSAGVILRSAAGGSWQEVDDPTTVDLRGVTFTGSQFVAAGDEGTILSSPDGRHWQIDTTAMPCALLSVAQGAGRYLAVGGSGQLISSTNGLAWQRQPAPTGEDLYGLAYGAGGFVAVGADGAVLQSTDGRSWTVRHLTTGLNLRTVAWTGTEYLIGGDRGQIFASADAVHWQQLPEQAFHSIRDFATGDGTTVAAGAGTVMRRTAGGSWTLEPVGFGHFQTSIAFGAGRFVIVGHNGEALVSSDGGRSWTTGTGSGVINLDRVVYADGRFIATGQGQELTSGNGLSWVAARLPTGSSIRSIAVAGSNLVAVGDLNTILRSTDGGRQWSVIELS